MHFGIKGLRQKDMFGLNTTRRSPSSNRNVIPLCFKHQKKINAALEIKASILIQESHHINNKYF